MTNTTEFRLLVIADVHYATVDQPAPPDRKIALGRELLRRAIDDAAFRGGFDAIVLTGDLVNDGRAPCADGDLAELKAVLEKAAPGVPVLCAPGNHDGPAGRIFAVFGDADRSRELGGYRFVLFADPYAAGDLCTRREADLRRLLDEASRPGGPIVAIQHNPMNPAVVDDSYPFMLTNRGQVLADYSRCGVLLSLSGHYHAGQAMNESGGVRYFTAPALCEWPFSYALVALRGREVRVETRRLAARTELGLADVHAHTELAYCGEGVTAAGHIERAATFGLECLCLTEHAPQLYCLADDFWNGRHIRRPELWHRDGTSRMARFRELVAPLRCPASPREGRPRVLAGLEVELDADGRLTLKPEDRAWPDILVGAVHFLRRPLAEMSESETIKEFMRATTGLLQSGVDVLAHPWRILDRRVGRRPELYPRLVEQLAATGTAAELNFHKMTNDPAFYALCVERGVPIALGSDAHEPHEVGNLGAHVALIEGVAQGRPLRDVLWHPSVDES